MFTDSTMYMYSSGDVGYMHACCSTVTVYHHLTCTPHLPPLVHHAPSHLSLTYMYNNSTPCYLEDRDQI